MVGNLIGVAPEGDQVLWWYGIGVQQPVTGRFGASLEAIGDFDAGGEHEVIGSVTWEAGRGAMVRLGVGGGLTAASPDVTLRTGLLWRF